MNIASFPFAFFCILLWISYFIVPGKLQWILLLVFSLFFYTRSGWPALIFLLITAAASFAAALWMEQKNAAQQAALPQLKDREEKAALREKTKKEKRHFFILLCFLIFGIWVVVKYSSMILSTVQAIMPAADLSGAMMRVDSFIVPLGISFYTFNAAGYVIDVSRKKYPAEHNFFKYLLFISFFPHIIQGPFSRFDRLGKTLFAAHTFDYDRMCQGLVRILYGYCEKLLVADKLAPTVSMVMANPADTPGVYLVAAVFGYGIQLYADFAGYMDIMIGICQIMGIELEENFRQPYFATSIQNYWQRWHITLGHWYSDYIFYPASMGKTAQKIGRNAREKFGARMGKLIPSYFAMIFVWTLTGLWHGARWTFVIWGWLNFFFIVFSMQMEPVYDKMKSALHINDKALWWRIVQVARTFLLVSLLRIFYCSTTVSGAIEYIRYIFTPNWSALRYPAQLLVTACAGRDISLIYISAGVLCMFVVDLFKENKWKAKIPMPIRCVFYGLLVCMLIIGAGNGDASQGGFLYAQF